jgi:uncharacterized protein (DUF608 family)
MPLGGIDTGCIDLETSGLWGYCTLFNTHVPRRGPLNLPFLGVNLNGQTWVLCDPSQIKEFEPLNLGGYRNLVNPPSEFPFSTQNPSLGNVKLPQEIHYWGHFPIADLEYEIDAPVSVGLRAWSPFLPGDSIHSSIPGAVFEVHLRNLHETQQQGSLAFSFPGPLEIEAGSDQYRHKPTKNPLEGLLVETPKASYLIGAIEQERLRFGGDLGGDGKAWSRIGEELPQATDNQAGASLAVDFTLSPFETKIIRLVLAWHSPQWRGGGYPASPEGHTFTHMYAKYYPSALETARVLVENHESILKRVLGWQEVIYTATDLPVWLRESLVSALHLLTEDGLWAQAQPPIPDWVRPQDGLFGMNESPRVCPQIECIPCSFYGNIPLVYLFPELALSTLRGYKGYQDEEGSPPWIFGGCTNRTAVIDFAMPTRGYQVTMNVPCYVDMVDRYLMASERDDVLREFYPSVKKAIEFMIDLNRGPDGIISMPDRRVSVTGMPWETEWYEWCEWHGMATHVGGVHLATLHISARMAQEVGDEAFARQCQAWLEAGQHSLETKMWNGTHYLNFWDPVKGKKSDHIFSPQLDGEWMARFHGLPAVFRPERVKTTLETIRRFNVSPTQYGVITFTHADGTLLSKGEWPLAHESYEPLDIHGAELFMLAMTYMYAGEVDFGLDLVRRYMHNITIEQRALWDVPAGVRGDTGKPLANDYYQPLMLWSLPAAITGGDLTAPLKVGGLVDNLLKEIAATGPYESQTG